MLLLLFYRIIAKAVLVPLFALNSYCFFSEVFQAFIIDLLEKKFWNFSSEIGLYVGCLI